MKPASLLTLSVASLLTLVGSGAWALDASKVNLPGNRFKAPTYEQMSAPQRKLLQSVLVSDLNATSEPLNVLMASPEAGLLIHDIGDYLHTKSGYTPAQRDMVGLMAARAWTAQRTWASFRQSALKSGLSQDTINALAAGKKPSKLSEVDEILWTIANDVLYHRMLSDKTFADARRIVGDEKLVNAVMLTPYYELLIMLEKLDDSKLGAGQTGELKPMTVKVTPQPHGALGPIPSFPALQEGEGPSTGQFKVVGGRYAPLKWAEMNEAQKKLADRLLNSWRRSVSSVFISMMRSPQLALVYENLGSFLNPRTAPMDVKIRNFATLMVTREWVAQFEYWAAHRNVVQSGMKEEQVAAITNRKRPENMEPNLAAAYDLCTELLEQRTVSKATYERAIRDMGARDTVGAVIMVGFYGMVAAQTEALLRYPMPDGIKAELPEE